MTKCCKFGDVLISQAWTGVVACRLMNLAHPGAVPQEMITFHGTQFSMIRNYKLLMDAFANHDFLFLVRPSLIY